MGFMVVQVAGSDVEGAMHRTKTGVVDLSAMPAMNPGERMELARRRHARGIRPPRTNRSCGLVQIARRALRPGDIHRRSRLPADIHHMRAALGKQAAIPAQHQGWRGRIAGPLDQVPTLIRIW